MVFQQVRCKVNPEKAEAVYSHGNKGLQLYNANFLNSLVVSIVLNLWFEKCLRNIASSRSDTKRNWTCKNENGSIRQNTRRRGCSNCSVRREWSCSCP